MAIHSTVLPWGIPRIEQPDGLQSTGLQRAGHDWAAEHARDGENQRHKAGHDWAAEHARDGENQRHKILEEGERTAIYKSLEWLQGSHLNPWKARRVYMQRK